MSRYVGSKWSKTLALLKDNSISAYVPKTVRMNSATLHQMLEEYRMVYIKPNEGTYGNGVMRVEWVEGEAFRPYRYQHGVTARTFQTYDEMYRDLLKWTRNRRYLVQKGIHLLKYHKRRFDIRVMVQHNLQKKWESSGLIGRVAHPKKIVTNYHSGGTPKAVEELMSAYLGKSEKARFMRKLRRLGTKVAKRMHDRFPGVKEIGLDVAVDHTLKPWILEVNTRPDPYIFNRLSDKRVFGKIIRYVRAYKKIYKKV